MQSLGRRIAAEAIGTALLLATVVGSGIMAQRLAGGNVALALLGNTLPTGAILVVLLLMFGQVSTTVRFGAGQWIAEMVAAFGLLLAILGCRSSAPTAVPYAVGLYITA